MNTALSLTACIAMLFGVHAAAQDLSSTPSTEYSLPKAQAPNGTQRLPHGAEPVMTSPSSDIVFNDVSVTEPIALPRPRHLTRVDPPQTVTATRNHIRHRAREATVLQPDCGETQAALINCQSDRHSPLGDVAALSTFRLRFPGRDHKLRHIGVIADNAFAHFILADQDSNDVFQAGAAWQKFSAGTSGEVSTAGHGRIELPIPAGPPNHTLVLKGFEFQRADDTDANVRTIGLTLDQASLRIHAVLLDDMGDDWRGFVDAAGIANLLTLTPAGIAAGPVAMADAIRVLNGGSLAASGASNNPNARPYAVRVQYAWIPNALVSRSVARSGSNYPTDSDPLRNERIALKGFYANFGNSDHHLGRFGIDLSGRRTGGRLLEFADSDFDDPMDWTVEAVVLRDPG